MSFARSSFAFFFGTFISRIIGLLREIILAGVFGAGMLLDAFFVAYKIPNMLRELLAEGALGASFTKVFTKTWQEDEGLARKLLAESLIFFGMISFFISFLGILFAAPMVSLISQNPDPQFFSEAVLQTRVLFPFIAFMTIGAIISGALHQFGRFFTSSVSSIFLSVGFVLGTLCFAPLLKSHGDWLHALGFKGDGSLLGLSLGVLLGGFLQTLGQGIALWRHLRKIPRKQAISDEVRKKLFVVIGLMGPMLIAGSAGQVNVLVNTNFATSLGNGPVSWLSFAFRVLQLPIGLFSVAIASVSLPRLTRSFKDGPQKISDELTSATKLMTLLMSSSFLFILIANKQIIALLFGHGAFRSEDVMATAEALLAYSFCLIGYGLTKVFLAYYYAKGRTKFAMGVSVFSMLINFVANYALVRTYGHVGLAGTFAIVTSINAFILLVGILRDGISISLKIRPHELFLLFGCFFALLVFVPLINAFFGDVFSVAKLQALFEVIISAIFVGVFFLIFGWIFLRSELGILFQRFRAKRG